MSSISPRFFSSLSTEQWGVSSNARPSLRRPRFDKLYSVAPHGTQVVTGITVAK